MISITSILTIKDDTLITKKKTKRAYGPPELTIGFTEREEPN